MAASLGQYAVIVTCWCAACHTPAHPYYRGTARNVITMDMIEATPASSVYELITKLRADFLRDRGPVSILGNQHARAVVFLNDQEYGIPETMRNIPTDRIARIHFYPGTDAVPKFGSQYGGGVIQLISRNQ